MVNSEKVRRPDVWTRRALNLALLAAAATPACGAEPKQPREAVAAPIQLRRGIALHMMNWPLLEDGPGRRFVWPPFEADEFRMSDQELHALRSAGFDFVRFPVSPELFMETRGARRVQLSGILRGMIERLRAADLKVLVDLHPTDNPQRLVDRSTLFRRYGDMIHAIAQDLSTLGDGVALELMNEPPVSSMERWRGMNISMIRAARAGASRLPLMVSPHDGSGFEELCAFEPLPANLGSLLYTFHYYEPGVFTHQTQIDAAKYITGLEWPPQSGKLPERIATARRNIAADTELRASGRAAALADVTETLEAYYERNLGPDAIAQAFAAVSAWADQNHIARDAIVLGEFGVVRDYWLYDGADEESRLAWLESVRRTAEANNFGWSAWAYFGWGGMAITSHKSRALDPGSLHALGLAPAN